MRSIGESRGFSCASLLVLTATYSVQIQPRHTVVVVIIIIIIIIITLVMSLPCYRDVVTLLSSSQAQPSIPKILLAITSPKISLMNCSSTTQLSSAEESVMGSPSCCSPSSSL